MKEKSIYTCDRHLDKAFDHFLDENEIFPYLERIEDKNCSYCDNLAVYVLKLTSDEETSQLL